MEEQAQQDKVIKLLDRVGLPYEKINFYGQQLTVTCKSPKTADKWANVLGKFATLRGITSHWAENQINSNTTLRPSKHKVWTVFARV